MIFRIKQKQEIVPVLDPLLSTARKFHNLMIVSSLLTGRKNFNFISNTDKSKRVTG